jgi:AraC family ethanolamine operon transcriptional activator
VSERTLQYAFGDVYGMSPHTYLKSLRLAAARRLLLRSPDERGAVKRAALDAGFRQLGRFSVEYRQFFAESPSETLARHGGARPR